MTSAAAAQVPSASIKSLPRDWQVDEVLDIPFTGAGEHVYFHVEKINVNSADIQHALARHFRLRPHDIGLSGLKDKYAVTRQWFSVAAPGDEWPLDMPDVTCLAVARHDRKLRRGTHSRNDFNITLRHVTGITEGDLNNLTAGVANYFGPQRVSQSNVDQAREWLLTRREGRRKQLTSQQKSRQGWYLSVLRSYLFNKVLHARENAGLHDQPIDGDVLEDGVPTGPLWGRGRSATVGEAQAIENAALRDEAALCHALEFAGVQQGRRAFAVQPSRLQITYQPAEATINLQFGLPPGAYATTLLASAMVITDAHP